MLENFINVDALFLWEYKYPIRENLKHQIIIWNLITDQYLKSVYKLLVTSEMQIMMEVYKYYVSRALIIQLKKSAQFSSNWIRKLKKAKNNWYVVELYWWDYWIIFVDSIALFMSFIQNIPRPQINYISHRFANIGWDGKFKRAVIFYIAISLLNNQMESNKSNIMRWY